MRSRPTALLAVMFAVSLVASACTSTTSSPSPAPSSPPSATSAPATPSGPSGTLTVAQQAILPRPDPYALTTNMEHSIVLSMYDPLSRVDEKGVLTYYLAKSYQAESDTSWIVTLKQGVKWSDGSEFTADDVVFTINRMKDPNTKTIWTAVYSYIASAEAVDKYTVRIKTTRKVVNLPQDYGRMSMMPKAAFEKMGADAFFAKPVTSGPFKFVEMVPGARIVLEANMDYHLGAPKLKGLVFKQVPDAATRVAEAVTAASDIVFDIPPTQIASINSSGKADVVAKPGVGRMIIEFALATTPELRDIRVREAVFLAIDADAINKAIYNGAGGAQTGWLDRHTFGQNKELKAHGHNLARAKSLLAAAYPNGLKMPFTIRTPDGLQTEDAALAMNEMLKAVGFQTEFVTLEAAAFTKQRNDGLMKGLYLQGSRNSTGDPDQVFRSYDPKREDKYIKDAALEKLIDLQASEPDPVKRAVLIGNVDKYIHDNFLGYNVLTWPGVEAVNKRVSGYIPSPFEVRWFHTISVK